MDKYDIDRLEDINIKEQKKKTSPVRTFLSVSIPLLKALAVIILFLISGKGYSPFGCRTQYLFTDRFWYNKQLVIFFTIYFVINLSSEDRVELVSPLATFAVSALTWLLFNIVSRLGETWWALKIPGYPGPLTWFGVVAFLLAITYIVDDIRRYYIAREEVKEHQGLIRMLYRLELVLVTVTAVVTGLGFYRSYASQRKLLKKNFEFWRFFFGVPVRKSECKSKFPEYVKQIKRARGSLPEDTAGVAVTPWLAVVGSILFVQWVLPRLSG